MEALAETKSVYYVALHGFNHRIVFQKDEDYEQFLAIFTRCKICYMVSCQGYCLLPGSCHCVVEGSNTAAVTKAFKQLAVMYAVYLGAREARRAAVWEPTIEIGLLDCQKRLNESLKMLLSLPVLYGICQSPSQYEWVWVMGR